MKRAILMLAALALLFGGVGQAGAGTIVYQNTTNSLGGGFVFNGSTPVGSNLVANVDVNELTLQSGSAGMQITSLTLLAANFNTSAVQARPTMYIWAADGPGGAPGTLLGDFVLPTETFSSFQTTIGLTIPNNTVIVPASGQIWAGIGFDNNNGATPITAAQLNDLGAVSYHPATVGLDGPVAYFIPPTSPSNVNDPAVIVFDTNSTANYGWTVQATPVPEPATLTLLGIGIAGIAGYGWRRKLAVA
jgi:hypothetical protein